MNDLRTDAQHALEQPEQGVPEADCGNMEPVAWMAPNGEVRKDRSPRKFSDWGWRKEDYIPLYTNPPRREWRGLTDEEIESIWDGYLSDYQLQMIRDIEDALKERNV